MDGAAVLAVRAAVVLVAAFGAQRGRGGAPPCRARRRRRARAVGRAVRAHPDASSSAWRPPRPSPISHWPSSFHRGNGSISAHSPSNQPPAALWRLFLCRDRVGAYGLERGLLASDGVLARRWLAWMGAALVTFLLWIAPTALIMERAGRAARPAIGRRSRFRAGLRNRLHFLLAAALRFATNRSHALDSLSDNAYGMYLVHYVFVVWLQYALWWRCSRSPRPRSYSASRCS